VKVGDGQPLPSYSKFEEVSIEKGELKMLTVMIVLVVAAFIITIMAAMSKAPLWMAVFILCVIELIRILPLK
jgi:uncharacterized protein (DUF983 family)